jgi:hypothetical protein
MSDWYGTSRALAAVLIASKRCRGSLSEIVLVEMDWTDHRNLAFHINGFGLPENTCHLCGTTNFGGWWLIALGDLQCTPKQRF